LEWAASLGETPATPEKMEEVASRFPKAKILIQQIHAVLVSLTTTGTVAFDIVKGTKKNMGLDVWRKLNRKFDPNNPVANLRLLRKIVRPSQVGMDQLISAIEQWEQDYKHYKDRTTEVLSDSMRKVCLQSMCPNDLSNHIDLNIVRLNTYDDLKREIERYVEQVVARNGPKPMDIGTLAKGDSKGKGKGEDKGKGKGKSYQASWSSTSGPTGSGKANGREQFPGNCSRCGKWGHKKADCYAKRDVNGNVLMEKPAQPGNGQRRRFQRR
jgi:hypothetical protein